MSIQIRKVLIPEAGDISKVTIVHATLPSPPSQHVQVRILYAGFSGTDVNMRRGKYPMQKKGPITPGSCLVGTVLANGESCTKFKVGDIVCCLSVYDGDSTAANLEEKYLVKVPEGMDAKVAPALVMDWNTAYGMVKHQAKVTPGQKVFIHGISGAIGWALAQLCTHRGASIYGTASPRNHAAIHASLPTATLFPYTDKAWIPTMQELGGVDSVFDALGFESWDESFSILNSTGFLIGYGGNLPALTGRPDQSMIPPFAKLFSKNFKFWDGRKTTFYWISRDRGSFGGDLEELIELVERGEVEVTVKKIFKLDEVRVAHETWNKQDGVGSLLIDCA